MKVIAGMGSIDDYPSFVEAGALEVFVGYVPHGWMQGHGRGEALNRREVLYYNVQIGSYSELQILQDMNKIYHVPVTIAMNALSYKVEDYPEILGIMDSCMKAGYMDFIVADPQFLHYLWKQKSLDPHVIVSGEYGELNESIVEEFAAHKVKRIIFPRQTSIREMETLIRKYPDLEYEAFILNEKCHYTGAYCNSIHCDELCHMCKVPYQYGGNNNINYREEEERLPGETGCGLCALWQLQEAGVTHLKVVSRGNGSDATVEDLHILQKALHILDNSASEEAYITKMKEKVFPHGCSGNCYYIQ